MSDDSKKEEKNETTKILMRFKINKISWFIYIREPFVGKRYWILGIKNKR